MPYVDHETRDRIDHGHPAQSVGELTYELQQVVQRFLLNHASNPPGMRYEHLAAVLGALEGCKADFVDRILMPYEACKAAENGDVWHAGLIATNRDVLVPVLKRCGNHAPHREHDYGEGGVHYRCEGLW